MTIGPFKRGERRYRDDSDGEEYVLLREGLARDGGSPPRWWYWTVVDGPNLVIDERTNDGAFYPTQRDAYDGLVETTEKKPQFPPCDRCGESHSGGEDGSDCPSEASSTEVSS